MHFRVGKRVLEEDSSTRKKYCRRFACALCKHAEIDNGGSIFIATFAHLLKDR